MSSSTQNKSSLRTTGRTSLESSNLNQQQNNKRNLSNENKITFLNENDENNINVNNTLSSIISSSSNNNNMVLRYPLNKSRFPRLQECAHFHYEMSTIDIPKNFNALLRIDASFDSNTQNSNEQINNNFKQQFDDHDSTLFHIQVTSNDKKWILSRTYENFCYLDKHLHDCIFDRKFSSLDEIRQLENQSFNKEQRKSYSRVFAQYLMRFCEIAFINPINCGPILNWFEVDNKGHRLYATDDSPINIPAIGAALVKKRYVAQNLDELSLDVGNMISVIDKPPSEETMWWRGKKELEVGFFPAECVELIDNRTGQLPLNVTDNLPKISQSVRLKHGKLITLLRSFFNNRPTRNHLQLKGILKQRVFGCDLGEHLSNTGKDVPELLRVCTDFIENHGMVDGIYRHTGLQSNIQRLRNAFDEERFHEIEQEAYMNDVHSVSSLLKMYFRELPNPLLTFQLYNKFISIAESLLKSINVEQKIIEIHDLVQQLPPPHYRTLVFLMRHLYNLAKSSSDTNMNTKNLAIVWAPNLLKSKEMDANSDVQYDMLYSITLQANIAEFLISNADTIFDDKFSSLSRRIDLQNATSNVKTHRPISVCHTTTGAKLLSLEEAQARDKQYKQVGPIEVPKFHTVIELNASSSNSNKKKKKDSSGKTKRKKNEIKSSSMTQSIILSSSDHHHHPNSIMTSSLMSTKSVNAPQLPPPPPQQPPIIPTPGPQIQQIQLQTAKSFMRNMRGGSTKSSQRELNYEQTAAINSDRSSTINNTSSFLSNNNTFRSSSTFAKNSPIPPPRVAAATTVEDQQEPLSRNVDLINKAQGSPILSTFRNENLNRSNSSVSRRSILNEKQAITKIIKDIPPPPPPQQNVDLDAVKRSNMQQFMNYINISKQQQQQNDDDNEVININDKFPIPPTTTTLITSSNDEPIKINQIDLLRLSTSPLSDSTPSSPSSSPTSNELVINEEINSYDNKIYISSPNLTTTTDENKPVTTTSAESVIVDEETGELFSKNKTQILSENIKNLVLNTTDDTQMTITQVVHKHENNDDSDCFYCKFSNVNSHNRDKTEPHESHHDGGVQNDDCIYCKLKNQSPIIKVVKRPQSSNAVFYDDTKVFEKNRQSLPAAPTKVDDDVVVVVVRKSVSSSDEENQQKSAKRRSTELNGVISPNNENKTHPPPLVIPRTSTLQLKTSSLPTRPVSVNTIIDSTSSSLQRSKSLAVSVFKNNDLNLKMKPFTVRNVEQVVESPMRKHSNNSSKENIEGDEEETGKKGSDENIILNKRKCSVNLDELKRRRSEDEQQKIELTQQPKPATRKTSYMSKSLQDTTSLIQPRTNSILVQQNSNIDDDTSTSINVKSKIKLMELKSTNLSQTSLSSPTSATQTFVLPPQTYDSPPQQIIRSNSLTVEVIDNKAALKGANQIIKNTEINDNNISKLIKLKPTFISTNYNPQESSSSSLPIQSSYKNPLANSVFIIETSSSSLSLKTNDNKLNKSNNSSIDDDYENNINNNNNILSKRQTVKQLKSKFENK